MVSFHCCGTSPPLQTRTTISSSLWRRAGSPLRVVLNSSTENPFGPTAFPFANGRMASVSSCIVGCTPSGMFSGHWSRPSAMFGSSLGDLALRRIGNHRTYRSRISSTSLRSTPFSSLTYAELRSRFPSRFIVLGVFVEAGLVAFSGACFEFADEVSKRSSARQPCATSEDFFQPSSRPFEGCCYGVLRVGASSHPLSVAMLRLSQPLHRAPRTNPVLPAGA